MAIASLVLGIISIVLSFFGGINLFGGILGVIGIILGRKSNNKGYLKGILFSTVCILLLTILSLIFKFTLNMNSLIYYVILLISTTFGSMLGINKKSKN